MFTEDLTPFFATGDFAYAATWTPAAGGGPFAVNVIFENGYFESPIGNSDVAGRETMCWASDAQLTQGSGIKRNDSIVIQSVTYKVADSQPDGTGVTALKLRT